LALAGAQELWYGGPDPLGFHIWDPDCQGSAGEQEAAGVHGGYVTTRVKQVYSHDAEAVVGRRSDPRKSK